MAMVALTVLLASTHAARADDSMSYREMADTMQMDDTARFGKLVFDRLEWRGGGGGQGRAVWDGQGWYGGDYNRLWLKSEGKYAATDPDRGAQEADLEVLWNRVVSRWWSAQAGGRRELGLGQSRTWLAVGLQGLAPQWFDTEVTLYVSDAGRTAGRLKAQYDLLLTQYLVLQPLMEAHLYGRPDPRSRLGSGLSDLEAGVRLRYELRRELAPYIGVVWLRRFGRTADLVRAAGAQASDLQWAIGLRVWF